MSEWKKVQIGDFLLRHKLPIDIKDAVIYKRITIRIKHNGISMRDEAVGKKIGTKKQFTVKGGQFLLSKIDARYGAFGIVPMDLDGAIITGNFWAYDVNSKLVNIDWLNQYTNSPDFYDLCERSSSGITHRKYLNEKIFLNFEILIPSIEEQKKIVDKNKDIESKYINLISENKNQIEYIKNLRQAILQDAIQGKLTEDWRKDNPNAEPAAELLKKIKAEKEKLLKDKKIKKEKPLPPITKEEIPFDLPKGWEWCRLGDIGNVARGKSPKYNKNSKSIMLNQKCVRWGFLDIQFAKNVSDEWLKTIESNLFAKIDDILVNSTGEGTIGRSAIVANVSEELLYDSHVLLYRSFMSKIQSKYIISIINSEFGQRQIDEAKGAKSTKQTELGVIKLKSIIIPLPSTEEQKIIVNKVGKIIKNIKNLEKEVKQNKTTTDLFMQSVLKDAFSK